VQVAKFSLTLPSRIGQAYALRCGLAFVLQAEHRSQLMEMSKKVTKVSSQPAKLSQHHPSLLPNLVSKSPINTFIAPAPAPAPAPNQSGSAEPPALVHPIGASEQDSQQMSKPPMPVDEHDIGHANSELQQPVVALKADSPHENFHHAKSNGTQHHADVVSARNNAAEGAVSTPPSELLHEHQHQHQQLQTPQQGIGVLPPFPVASAAAAGAQTGSLGVLTVLAAIEKAVAALQQTIEEGLAQAEADRMHVLALSEQVHAFMELHAQEKVRYTILGSNINDVCNQLNSLCLRCHFHGSQSGQAGSMHHQQEHSA
jgi:hypothetical protein